MHASVSHQLLSRVKRVLRFKRSRTNRCIFRLNQLVDVGSVVHHPASLSKLFWPDSFTQHALTFEPQRLGVVQCGFALQRIVDPATLPHVGNEPVRCADKRVAHQRTDTDTFDRSVLADPQNVALTVLQVTGRQHLLPPQLRHRILDRVRVRFGRRFEDVVCVINSSIHTDPCSKQISDRLRVSSGINVIQVVQGKRTPQLRERPDQVA